MYGFSLTTALWRWSADCGGLVTNLGGTITMMNMTEQRRREVPYDCLWLVQPPQEYNLASHLALRVAEFDNMCESGQSYWSFRSGYYSESLPHLG